MIFPIASVLWSAFFPRENIWPHLLATTLPRYLSNSLILMAGVGLVSAAVGSVTAWLITMYRFPMARSLEWALLLPLAVPAYVGAYAMVDFLEFAGPVQIALRELFGWSSARDYYFPEIRSRGMAIVVLSAGLYPYVYLMTRAALREQSACSYEVARALGAGPFRRFFRLGLPLSRPAIFAGTAIVMMETVSDFGVVEFFAVQTLTTGIFSVWLESYNAGGAAQISTLVLVLVLVLVSLERISRARSRYYGLSRKTRPFSKVALTGWQGMAAALFCLVPVSIGFVLPVSIMAWHALGQTSLWSEQALLRAIVTSLGLGLTAALITVGAAVIMVYGIRQRGRRFAGYLLPLSTIGYAAPGAVLGVGLLVPVSALDNWLADALELLSGWDPGLLLTGTGATVVYAYVTRFFAIGVNASDTAMGRISPSLPMAARALGQDAGGTLRHVYVPMMRGSVATAVLLVFVDSIKELPATLLLRPFNFNTLATRVYEQASLEKIETASAPALLIILVGLTAVFLLIRNTR